MEWFVLYQPQERVPHVFNLHDRGLFKTLPKVTRPVGARVMVNAKKELAVEACRIVKEFNTDDRGRTYYFASKRVSVPLTQKLTLNKKALGAVGDTDIKDRIISVHQEWLTQWVPKRKDGKTDMAGLKKRLSDIVSTS